MQPENQDQSQNIEMSQALKYIMGGSMLYAGVLVGVSQLFVATL